MHFDEVFTEQVLATGKIEEGRTIREFFKRTNQPLLQDWLVNLVKGLLRRLPVKLLFMMGLQSVLRPRTSGWAGSRAAIEEYVAEQKAQQLKSLGLDALIANASKELDTPISGPAPEARS